MQFSQRFKQICKGNGVTQKQALSDMGMGRNAAQSWVEGSPSFETIHKIADYFGMSADDVIGTDNKKTPTPKGERDNKRDYLKLVEAFENADDSTREAILLLLKLK